MGEERIRKIEGIRRSLSMVKPMVIMSVGVLLPVILSTATGIVAIVIGESSVTLIMGILVVSFTAAAIGGSVLVYVLLGRRARIARFQSDLVANVSHDLRTPLAAIRLHAQTLQSGLLLDNPGAAAASVAAIVRETEWLETMVERILSWRAATRDRDLLHFRTGSVAAALGQAAERFQRMVPADEMSFTCRCPTELPVRHDPHALEQAVLNLLVNAHKYSRPPHRIELSAEDDRGGVTVVVADNGIGIPTSEFHRIFGPFYRVGRTESRVAGAGLGLAVVHHLVQAHGGQIRVESIEGTGSRFIIWLPAAPPDKGAVS